MVRTVQQVTASGYLTAAERRAIKFAAVLELNEGSMGEQAAIAATCEMFNIDYEDYPEMMMELPDGDWWELEELPVRGEVR